MNGMRVVASLAAATLLLAGCGNKNKPTLEPTVQRSEGQTSGNGEPATVARQLRSELPAYKSAYAPLPARDDEQNRQQIADAFEAAGRLLATLQGPQPGGAFRQQLRILDNARQRLASASQSLAIEPTVNAGLRALYNALDDLRLDEFAGHSDVSQPLDAMRLRVNDLDTVRGPLHRLVVAQVFRAADNVFDGMTTVLESRSSSDTAGPAEQPDSDQPQAGQPQQPATAPAPRQ